MAQKQKEVLKANFAKPHSTSGQRRLQHIALSHGRGFQPAALHTGQYLSRKQKYTNGCGKNDGRGPNPTKKVTA